MHRQHLCSPMASPCPGRRAPVGTLTVAREPIQIALYRCAGKIERKKPVLDRSGPMAMPTVACVSAETPSSS